MITSEFVLKIILYWELFNQKCFLVLFSRHIVCNVNCSCVLPLWTGTSPYKPLMQGPPSKQTGLTSTKGHKPGSLYALLLKTE